MSDIERLLKEEAEYAEAHKDEPLRGGTSIIRRGQKSKVYTLRLTESEYARLEIVAEKVGLPPSTLVRTWIAERLAAEDPERADFQAMASTLEAISIRLAAVSARERLARLSTLEEVAEANGVELGDPDMSLLDDVQ
ncbi:MAG: hypothetical protein QM705_11640 [Ancrocorticia sp.]